jgi:hypothetical protein
MPAQPQRRTAPPRDQAHGLRQLFAGQDLCFLPMVHNPHVPGAGVVMERLCAALGELGLRTLVVDAADSASPAHQLAAVDLAACIERLSPQVAYLQEQFRVIYSRLGLSGANSDATSNPPEDLGGGYEEGEGEGEGEGEFYDAAGEAEPEPPLDAALAVA